MLKAAAKTENLHEFVVRRLDECGKDEWERIAAESGVPYHTILKIARQITRDPRYHTLDKLARHFQAGQAA